VSDRSERAAIERTPNNRYSQELNSWQPGVKVLNCGQNNMPSGTTE
jgi:hypothetical protein